MNNFSPRLLATLAICTVLAGCFGGSKQYIPEAQGRAETLLKRAIRAEEKNQPELAEELFKSALAASSAIEHADLRAITLVNLGRLQRLNGRLAESSEAIDSALGYVSGPGEIFAEAAQEKALLELSAGRLASARSWAERSVAAENGRDLGRRLNLLGRIQVAQGDERAALKTLGEALANNRRQDCYEEEANSLRLMGIAARLAGRHNDAGRLLTEALEIDKFHAWSAKIAADLEELAETSRGAGDSKKAAGYLERAFEVHLNGGRLERAAHTLAQLRHLNDSAGDRDRAEWINRKTKALARLTGDQARGTSPETTKPSKSP